MTTLEKKKDKPLDNAKGKKKEKAMDKTKGKDKSQDSTTKTIVFDTTADRLAVAEQALADSVIMEALAENLSTADRRTRQFSAAAIHLISEKDAQALIPFIDQIVDALHRPEAQTRWECLETLVNVAMHDAESCSDAIAGAESSLFDDSSGAARLAAVRFLCAFGAGGPKRAAKIWSLLDEAIQCYHGDAEFQDMLVSIISFAEGNIGKEVAASLAERMTFDAENSRGTLKRRAVQIVELCKQK